MSRRICKRCLLMELGEEKIAHSVREYIDSLDSSIKTPARLYQQRLEQCQNCDQLVNGMCRHCGCFVEARAAKRNQSCPGIPAKW